MAGDRIVNVPINFTINSVQVDKYEQAAKRADQATEKLRQSTQNFANTSSRGFQSSAKSIEGMEIELARLRQQIKLVDTADKQRLSQLSAQYKTLKTQVDAYNRSLFEQSAATRQAAQATQGLASQFGQVYTAIRLLITAGLVKEIVDMSLSMAKLSGNVEGVSRAFNRLPGAVTILGELRKATHGTVTDLDLMQRALKAVNFGLSLKALPDLLEFAAVRAQQTGVSVDYLVNSIVDGIGRKSLRVLDNLQIAQSRIKEELGGISMEAATVAQVSEAMGRIASEELKKMGGFAETSATEVEQLATKWDRLKVSISKALTSPGLIAFYNDVVEGMQFLTDYASGGMKRVEEQRTKMLAEQNVSLFKEMNMTKEVLKDRQKSVDLVQQEINTNVQLIGRNNDELKKIKEKWDAIVNSGRMMSYEEHAQVKELQKQDLIYDKKKRILIETNNLLKDYLKSLQTETIVQDEGSTAKVDSDSDKKISDFSKKTKEEGEEVREYLAYLSDLEMHNVRTMLDERIKARADATKEELEIEKQAQQERERLANEELRKKQELHRLILELGEDLVRNTLELAFTSRDEDIDGISDYYNEQIKLAGDNERAKETLEIKRERALEKARARQKEADKKEARTKILIDGLIAIAKIFAEYGWPAGIVPSLIMAGITATNAEQVGKYKDGVIDLKGPGTKTSDSIPAMLSRGESVMTADETEKSKGVLKAIRAKKLNDRILKEIMSGKSGGSASQIFDDSKIIKELQEIKNATPDIELRGNMIFEYRKKGDNYRMRIRKKSLGY